MQNMTVNYMSNVRAEAGLFSYVYFYFFTDEKKNRHAKTER